MMADEAMELLFRGAASGALLVWAATFVTSRASLSVRFAGLLFCLAALGFALNEDPVARQTIGVLTYPLWFLSVAAAGYLWLLIAALFEDRKLGIREFVVPLLLTILGLAAYLSPSPVQAPLWMGHHLLEFAIASHAMVVIVASWRGDLVETRRRLRGSTMAAVIVFVFLWSGLELRRLAIPDAADDGLWVSAALAMVAIVSTAAILQMRPDVFGAALPASAPVRVSDQGVLDADAVLKRRIITQMQDQKIWQQEGLSIAELADAAAVPEYRLRAYINEQLGHRNFSAFVNHYRIEAAKIALADPAKARQTVAAIAFDLGFGSLGPFNRAFRDAVGMTPTAFRASESAKIVAEK
jgi:AraC-like DNA-binding protein